jgi:hypothetical protein
LIFAATLSPTAPHRMPGIGSCGTHLTTTGGLTSTQGLLNVLLFIPAAGMLTLASGRLADGIAAGIGMSAAMEAVQALIPQLGRSCQLHDLVANSLGAIAGVALAATVQLVLRPVSRPHILTSPVYVVEQARYWWFAGPRLGIAGARWHPAMAKSSSRLRPVARAR